MLRKVCSVVGLAILLAAGSANAQQSIQSRKLPASALRKMTSKTVGSDQSLKKYGAVKNEGATKNSVIKNAATSGTPGIDSVVNWSDQFTSPGYDSNGNAQSVW